MHAVAEISVTPVGSGVSISKAVSQVQSIIQTAGLKHAVHACGTNIEGDLDVILAVVKECQTVLHESGHQRVSTFVRLDTRTDKESHLEERVKVVERVGSAAGA